MSRYPHVVDYVRRVTVMQDPEPQPPQVMWSVESCYLRIEQTRVPCHICGLPIQAGELFYPVTAWEGRIVSQVHQRCDQDARR